jgi:hypothetical protein
VVVTIVTKRLLVNVDGCFVRHAHEGVRALATSQHRESSSPHFGKQCGPERREKVYLSDISTDTSRECSPPASGVAAGAALIGMSEPFFIGLFNAGAFAAGFLACCLGIGGVAAAGRAGGVDGAGHGPTAAATDLEGTMCVPIRLHFALATTTGMVAPGVAGAPPAAQDPAVASSTNLAGAGRGATIGGCGAAMGASTARVKAKADRGGEIGGEGDTEAGGGRAEISAPPMPRTRWGSG